MKSPMLEAFLKQQKFTDKQADEYQANIEKYKEANYEKAKLEMSKDQAIKNCINIPSKINTKDIEQTHEIHAKLKGYDHSLEAIRMKFKNDGTQSDYTTTITGTDYKLADNQIGIDWGALAKKLG